MNSVNNAYFFKSGGCPDLLMLKEQTETEDDLELKISKPKTLTSENLLEEDDEDCFLGSQYLFRPPKNTKITFIRLSVDKQR